MQYPQKSYFKDIIFVLKIVSTFFKIIALCPYSIKFSGINRKLRLILSDYYLPIIWQIFVLCFITKYYARIYLALTKNFSLNNAFYYNTQMLLLLFDIINVYFIVIFFHIKHKLIENLINKLYQIDTFLTLMHCNIDYFDFLANSLKTVICFILFYTINLKYNDINYFYSYIILNGIVIYIQTYIFIIKRFSDIFLKKINSLYNTKEDVIKISGTQISHRKIFIDQILKFIIEIKHCCTIMNNTFNIFMIQIVFYNFMLATIYFENIFECYKECSNKILFDILLKYAYIIYNVLNCLYLIFCFNGIVCQVFIIITN